MPQRLWRIGLLAAALIAVVLQLPVMVGEASRAWDVARAWPDRAEQYRLIVEGAPSDLLAAADATLPRDATLLLVTSGADVRGREYRTFHRALYFLTPRPVYWVNPAPADGTWESRWWRTVPDLPVSTCAEAARVRATHVLLLDVAPPMTPCAGVALVDDSVAADGASRTPSAWRLVAGSIVALMVPMLIGAALVGRLARRAALHAGQRAAAAWAVGTGVVALADIALGLVGLPPTLRLGALASAGVAAAFVLGRERLRRRRLDRVAIAPASLAAATALTPFVALVALLSVGLPWSIWDGWAIWGMKARTLFVEGRLTDALFADPTRASVHPGYPLNVPAIEAWLFNWIGAPDDRVVGLLAVATFAALLAAVFGTLRRAGTDRLLATAVVAAFASMYFVWRVASAGFADVPLALLATVATIVLLEWLRSGDRRVLVLAALAAGLMPWTKMEGALLLVMLATTVVVAGIAARDPVARRRGLVGAAAIVVAGIALSGWWWLMVALSGAPSADYQPGVSTFLANLSRVPTIAGMELEMLAGQGWSFFWPIAALITLVWLVRRGRQGPDTHVDRLAWVMPVTAVVYFAVVSGAYVFTTFEPFTAQVESSAFRLALHVLPLIVIWTVGAAQDLFRATTRGLARRRPA